MKSVRSMCKNAVHKVTMNSGDIHKLDNQTKSSGHSAKQRHSVNIENMLNLVGESINKCSVVQIFGIFSLALPRSGSVYWSVLNWVCTYLWSEICALFLVLLNTQYCTLSPHSYLPSFLSVWLHTSMHTMREQWIWFVFVNKVCNDFYGLIVHHQSFCVVGCCLIWVFGTFWHFKWLYALCNVRCSYHQHFLSHAVNTLMRWQHDSRFIISFWKKKWKKKNINSCRWSYEVLKRNKRNVGAVELLNLANKSSTNTKRTIITMHCAFVVYTPYASTCKNTDFISNPCAFIRHSQWDFANICICIFILVRNISVVFGFRKTKSPINSHSEWKWFRI